MSFVDYLQFPFAQHALIAAAVVGLIAGQGVRHHAIGFAFTLDCVSRGGRTVELTMR